MYDINLDVRIVLEALKTKILFDRTSCSSSFFLTVILKYLPEDEVVKVATQGRLNGITRFTAVVNIYL